MITDQDFIKTYMECEGNRQKIATELGMTVAGVHGRIAKYKKYGVKLPDLRPKGPRFDVQELNQLIKSYR